MATLSIRAEWWLLVGFIATLTAWLVLSILVMVDRELYDRRAKRLLDVRRALQSADQSTVEDLIAPLPRRAVFRLIADLSNPRWLNEAFARYAIDRWGREKLNRDARGGDKWRRIAALSTLTHSRARGVHDLLRDALLFERDPDLGAAAVALLSVLEDHLAAEILIEALRRRSFPPSRVATYLDRFALPLDTLLRPLLKDPFPWVRYWAASLLIRYPHAGAGAELAALTKDADASVRKVAVKTLAATRDPLAADVALKLLSDPADFVRSQAARSLAKIADTETTDAMRRRFAKRIARLLGDNVWEVRHAAKESLVALGRSVWRDVAAQLESEDRFVRNSAAEVMQNLCVIDDWIKDLSAGTRLIPTARAALERSMRAGGSQLLSAAWARSNSAHFPNLETFRTRLAAAGVNLTDEPSMDRDAPERVVDRDSGVRDQLLPLRVRDDGSGGAGGDLPQSPA